jgi:hypothetical protein
MPNELKIREQLKIDRPKNWPFDRVKHSPTSVRSTLLMPPRPVAPQNTTIAVSNMDKASWVLAQELPGSLRQQALENDVRRTTL